jgi:hypothetical protein
MVVRASVREKRSLKQKILFCGASGFSSTGRHMAQAAAVIAMQIARMDHEISVANRAARSAEHARVDKFHQAPSTCNRQDRINPRHGQVLQIQRIGLDDRIDGFEFTGFLKIFIDPQEQRRMHIRLPRHEPVGRERQHALGRRLVLDFLVQAQQALPAQVDFRLEQLQTRAQTNEFGGALDFLRIGHNAFQTSHIRPPSRSRGS